METHQHWMEGGTPYERQDCTRKQTLDIVQQPIFLSEKSSLRFYTKLSHMSNTPTLIRAAILIYGPYGL